MFLSILIINLFLVIAYLLGSIPTGYLAGRLLKDIDIRELGSGSTGATNVLRLLGKKAGASVLIIDMLKGAIAVLNVKILYHYFPNESMPLEWQNWLILGVGLMAILGHSKSIWLNFSGGKSVATSVGVLLMMNPIVGLGTFLVFLVVFSVSRIVSLSSIIGAIAVGILMVVLNQPLPFILFGFLAGIYVIIRHLSNIERLLKGTEPKIGQKELRIEN
jgi:glycerol-3-phosphate acyltransferase PlsY